MANKLPPEQLDPEFSATELAHIAQQGAVAQSSERARLEALVAKMQADKDAGRRSNPVPTVDELFASRGRDAARRVAADAMSEQEKIAAGYTGRADDADYLPGDEPGNPSY